MCIPARAGILQLWKIRPQPRLQRYPAGNRLRPAARLSRRFGKARAQSQAIRVYHVALAVFAQYIAAAILRNSPVRAP
jgi:hypothetical protein